MAGVRRFIALSLIVIGIFWMGFSGLCTAAFGVSFLQNDQTLSDIAPVLLIGVPSVIIGYAIFAFGRWLRDRPHE
jgi:uncharacterized membrane protein HdeD (DUF308 family)